MLELAARDLAEEGTSFTAVLAAARRDRADELLRNSDLQLAQILLHGRLPRRQAPEPECAAQVVHYGPGAAPLVPIRARVTTR